MKRTFKLAVLVLFAVFFPTIALAAPDSSQLNLNLTTSTPGLLTLVFFLVAYMFVMTEELTHLRKSKPVIVAAGFIWGIVAWAANEVGQSEAAHRVVEHNILEYAELFMFLLVAMTFVNAMEERRVFEALRVWLVNKSFSYRQLFWVTGFLAFFISPIADNLTTALLMCAVVMAVGSDNLKFVTIACINIVVAANAGGAFSPFGDITTLMVWQQGILKFLDFFNIFVPSLVSYVIPAAIMHFAIPRGQPSASHEFTQMKYGARRVILLFMTTIVLAIFGHHNLHLPPMIGMMTGLGLLTFFSYHITQRELRLAQDDHNQKDLFNIFKSIKNAEWDTLFFFYGVILCVGGLATMGYLASLSHYLYDVLGSNLPSIHQATPANSIVGVLSAIIDNIPVMFAVLTMQPDMSQGQWLLVTLTAGIGGSMLSVGSAAGVALMGQAKGKYTFFGHLKWSWAIALGYIAGIGCHLWLSHDLLSVPIR